jgi:hypothetical protein
MHLLQGNCAADPLPVDLGLSGPGDLISRNPQQCILVIDVRLFRAEQNLWLDNLYIRYIATNRSRESSLVDCLGGTCNLWLTAVTLHGYTSAPENATVYDNGAVAVVGGQMYADGTIVQFLYPLILFCAFFVCSIPQCLLVVRSSKASLHTDDI